MKLGHVFICAIATRLGEASVDNGLQAARFGKDEAFLDKRIGVRTLPEASEGETAVALGTAAARSALDQAGLAPGDVELLILVTQNPDHGGLPHNAALVQDALGLPETAMCFDMGLGCSGWVYAVCTAAALMKAGAARHALVVTSDQYRAHLGVDDVNTRLLFGDGAAATVLSLEGGPLEVKAGALGTDGSQHSALIRRHGEITMNGRAVFDFSRRTVPDAVRAFAQQQGLALDRVDALLLHQGSRAIVDEITKRLGLLPDTVPVELEGTGNTVSSSLAFLLAPRLFQPDLKHIVTAGFGVGLSWGCVWLERKD